MYGIQPMLHWETTVAVHLNALPHAAIKPGFVAINKPGKVAVATLPCRRR
jgi:hypothetical protein